MNGPEIPIQKVEKLIFNPDEYAAGGFPSVATGSAQS
ncbi:hypothetical protein ANO14919_125650 [Xylariales sp. No.14919]|nr:hypothetical protein ANO14919_125650 [Xylariales sp. No.14919]